MLCTSMQTCRWYCTYLPHGHKCYQGNNGDPSTACTKGVMWCSWCSWCSWSSNRSMCGWSVLGAPIFGDRFHVLMPDALPFIALLGQLHRFVPWNHGGLVSTEACLGAHDECHQNYQCKAAHCELC